MAVVTIDGIKLDTNQINTYLTEYPKSSAIYKAALKYKQEAEDAAAAATKAIQAKIQKPAVPSSKPTERVTTTSKAEQVKQKAIEETLAKETKANASAKAIGAALPYPDAEKTPPPPSSKISAAAVEGSRPTPTTKAPVVVTNTKAPTAPTATARTTTPTRTTTPAVTPKPATAPVKTSAPVVKVPGDQAVVSTNETEGFGLGGITATQAAESYRPGIEQGLGRPLTREDYLPGGVVYQLGQAQNFAPEVGMQYGTTFAGKGGTSEIFNYKPITPEVQRQIDTLVFGSPQAKERYFAPGGLGETVAANRGITLDQLQAEMLGTGGYSVDSKGTLYLQGGAIYDNAQSVLQATIGGQSVLGGGIVNNVSDNSINTNTLNTNNVIANNKDTGPMRTARDSARALAAEFGLGDDFFSQIEGFLFEGISKDSLTLALRGTDAYKKRFSANAKRVAKGLPALSEGEYLQSERLYRQTLQEAGLPKEFYDNQDDFNIYLENDINYNEFVSRVNLAQRASQSANPEIKAQLKNLYNIDETGLVAYFLNPERAKPLLQKQLNVAQTAAALQQSGFGTAQAEDLTIAMTGGSPQSLLDYGKVTQGIESAFQMQSLAQQTLGGEAGAVSEQDLLRGIAAEDVSSAAAIQKEQRRRLAEFQAGGGYAEGQQGVTGLRRAAR